MNATAENVVQLLQRRVERTPQAPALLWDTWYGRARRVDYRDLWERSGQTAAQLRRVGVGPGDRVLVYWPLGLPVYVCLTAILRRGATAVFLDPWFTGDQLQALVEQLQPKAMLGSPRARLLRLLRPALRRVPWVPLRGHRYGASRHACTRPDLVHPRAADNTALMTFTTGSSGTPKCVRRTHGILAAQHRALARAFPVQPGDVDCTNLPVFVLHNLALGVPTLLPRLDVRRLSRLRPRRLLGQWRRHGVTTGTFSPALLDRVTGWMSSRTAEPPRLRRVLAGGAAMSEAQVEQWQQAFPDTSIELLYGSSEAEPVAHISAGARTRAQRRHAWPGHCVGRPVPEVDVRIRDQGPDGIGEVMVRGAHVCCTEEESVWHGMGDLGRLDPLGRLWLVGQAHATIRHRTGVLHAGALEQQIQAKCTVPVVALALPGEHGFQRLVLVVQAPEDPGLRQELARTLVRLGIPADEVVFRHQALPMDPRHQSKVDRRALGRWLHQRQEVLS